MLAGADSIDDCDLLRSGSTESFLADNVVAPSTLGTFLRGMGFGHVRQREAVAGKLSGRAWRQDTGPGGERLTVDLDFIIGQVRGYESRVPSSVTPVSTAFTLCLPPGPRAVMA